MISLSLFFNVLIYYFLVNNTLILGGNIMKKLIEKIIDTYRKPKIFKLAAKLGRDLDGDIITYKGTRYYFHIFQNILKRV